jgi:septal ring factor EnvC (AmiA/AmiB activator)
MKVFVESLRQSRLVEAEAEIRKLRAKLKESGADDDEVSEEAEDAAQESERKKKEKQKKSLDDNVDGAPDDTTTSPARDPRDPDAADQSRVRATVAAVLAAHGQVTDNRRRQNPARISTQRPSNYMRPRSPPAANSGQLRQ